MKKFTFHIYHFQLKTWLFGAAALMANQPAEDNPSCQAKENEKKIYDLTEELRILKEKLKDHEENCQPRIKKLEEEIERLKKEQLKEHEEILKTLVLSKDELIIRQLCTSVQQNLLKIVLKDDFKQHNTSTKYINDYIKRQIGDKQEQKRAKSRWKKIKKEVNWDGFLIKQLKPLKQGGNDAAHPDLKEEEINAAKRNLKKEKKFDEDMVQSVDRLTTIWKETNRKLHE